MSAEALLPLVWEGDLVSLGLDFQAGAMDYRLNSDGHVLAAFGSAGKLWEMKRQVEAQQGMLRE